MPSNDTPVKFRCHPDAEDEIPMPRPATEALDEIRDQGQLSVTMSASTQHDVMVRDAAVQGWMLYPPETATLTIEETEAGIDATVDSPAVTTQPTMCESLPVEAVVETGWYASVPSNRALLVTPPLYDSNAPAVPQLIHPDDEFAHITVPVAVTETTVFTSTTPLAQCIPVSSDPLPDAGEVTQLTPEIADALEKTKGLHDVYRDPYVERIRAEKQPGRITRVPSSPNDTRE